MELGEPYPQPHEDAEAESVVVDPLAEFDGVVDYSGAPDRDPSDRDAP